jgi:chromosome segregation ATPase
VEKMTNDNSELGSDAIVFDLDSGISEDEQKEILAKINDITESHRRSLAAGTEAFEGKENRFTAKKSGILFPVLVNALALVALVGGFFVLSSFQGKTDAQVRMGTKVYSSVERALIEEIRRETSSRLEAKENEILMISSQLEGIDSELRGLYSNSGDLTDEQRAAELRLKSLQKEYLASLENLQDERSRILEEARSREAVLQTRLENRTRELTVTEEQSPATPELIQGELERLSSEQARAATVEAQMNAFLANLYEQVNDNRLDAATVTIQSMRTFLNTPSFQALRSVQARIELYTESVNAFEVLMEEARKNRAAPVADARPPDASAEQALAELQEKYAELERTVTASATQSSSTTGRVAELERANRALEQRSREKDSTISALQSDLATQTQNVLAVRQQVTTHENTIINLNNQLTQLRLALQALNQ